MPKPTATQVPASAAPPGSAAGTAPVPAAALSDEPRLLGMSPEPPLLDGASRDEMIRARAYERYEHNGCVDGHAVDDWLAAEAEVGALLTEAGQLASAIAA